MATITKHRWFSVPVVRTCTYLSPMGWKVTVSGILNKYRIWSVMSFYDMYFSVAILQRTGRIWTVAVHIFQPSDSIVFDWSSNVLSYSEITNFEIYCRVRDVLFSRYFTGFESMYFCINHETRAFQIHYVILQPRIFWEFTKFST